VLRILKHGWDLGSTDDSHPSFRVGNGQGFTDSFILFEKMDEEERRAI
jgi:hypothetical protein